MRYRKFKADSIFDGKQFLQNRILVVKEDNTIEAIVTIEEAGEDILTYNGILMPGLINCHCHLELSHMKGKIPEDTGLVDFVFKVVMERAALEENILIAIDAAETEMKSSGIVAVGDICNNTLSISQKQKGNLHYYNFIEASGWLPSVSGTRFERAKWIYDKYEQLPISNEQWATSHGESNLKAPNPKPQTSNCSIVPHAPYSVSNNLWRQIQPYFQHKIVSIHNQETKFEDDFFLKGSGDFTRMYEMMKIDNLHHQPTKKTSLQSYYHHLWQAEKIILVHNTFTGQEDIDYVKQQITNNKPQTFFCLCINANQYIENALPPIDLFRKNKCSIVLGTDSLASNRSLSIIDEIKTIRKNYPHISLEEILGWATINGAKALEMDVYLGSFEKGKKPGIVNLKEKGLDGFELKRII
jgi:cytosine/adenosine deaminase-related metal-dependent hydrolase